MAWIADIASIGTVLFGVAFCIWVLKQLFK